MLLTSGREQTRLDMTHGHDRPSLGTHITNSVGQANAVLPNPLRLPSGGLVDHAVRQGGMARHDWLTMPARGDSGEQGLPHEAIIVIVCRTSGTHKKVKDNAILEAPFPPRFSLSLSPM